MKKDTKTDASAEKDSAELSTQPLLHTLAVHSVVSALVNIHVPLAVSGVTTPVIDFGQTPTSSSDNLQIEIDGEEYDDQNWSGELETVLTSANVDVSEELGKLIQKRNRVVQAVKDHQSQVVDESKFINWFEFVQEQLRNMNTGTEQKVVIQKDKEQSSRMRDGNNQVLKKPVSLGMQEIQNKIVFLQDWYHCLFDHDQHLVELINLPLYTMHLGSLPSQSSQGMYQSLVKSGKPVLQSNSNGQTLLGKLSDSWSKTKTLFLPIDTDNYQEDLNSFEQWDVGVAANTKLLAILEAIQWGNGDVKHYSMTNIEDVKNETVKNVYSNMVTLDYFNIQSSAPSTKIVDTGDVTQTAQGVQVVDKLETTQSWFMSILGTLHDAVQKISGHDDSDDSSKLQA